MPLILTALLLLGLWQSAGPDIITDPDSYAVYAAVLEAGWPKPNVSHAPVALVEKTAARPPCTSWDGSLPPEWRQAIDSYARENDRVRWLVADANLGVPYALITSSKFDDLLMEVAGDVKRIWDDYWGQMSVSMSAVGFDAARTHALVTLQYSCQSGCAGGKHFLMEKRADGWRQATVVAACE